MGDLENGVCHAEGIILLKYLKSSLDADLKIILLGQQKNSVDHSKHNEQGYKIFSGN